MLALALTLVTLASLVSVAAATETMVLVDDYGIPETHSSFFSDLRSRGHVLTIKHVYDEGVFLSRFGEWHYDNLILFAPTAQDFGPKLSVSDVTEFVDSGRNLLVAVNGEVSEPIREIANECGVDFDGDGNVVIDHIHHDKSDRAARHSKLVVEDTLKSKVILGQDSFDPILFRGVGINAATSSELLVPVLRGSASAYSGVPGEVVSSTPRLVGSETQLLTAMQARNNARVVFSGSLELFSDAFFTASVSSMANAEARPSGNQQFCHQLSLWNFQERGMLRYSQVFHSKISDMHNETASNPERYRVKDEVVFSLVIEELDGVSKQWKPFQAGPSELMLEFIMMDPYVRIPLEHKGNGKYAVEFKLPDVYGIFDFKLQYSNVGYSSLEIIEPVTVHPFNHNEYPRFLFVAYPYYTAVALNMGAFFVFGLLFLFTKSESESVADKAKKEDGAVNAKAEGKSD